MQASPITITVTVTILASGCSVHAARAQQAPTVAASSPTNPIDPLEGKVVREIPDQSGPSTVDGRHCATPSRVTSGCVLSSRHARGGSPAARCPALVQLGRIKPVAAGDEVVLEVDVKETLRLLPLIALSVTDENGVSAGPAFKGINLFGRGTLSSGTAQFGGTTTVSARVERPTVTPGMWALDARTVYRSRRNELFDFDETSTTIEASGGWNWTSRMQVGGRAEFVWFDTGSAEIALSPSGTDHLPAVGLFVTYNSLDPLSNPRVGWFGSVDIARQFGDARSWTLTLDGRRLQPLSARSTLSLVAFAESQSGVVGRDLPEYYQFGIGGTNSVRGWALGSRIGKNQAIATVEYSVIDCARPAIHLVRAPPLRRHSSRRVQRRRSGVDRPFPASDAIDGYGVGLRLLVPFVDVVRLDLAFGEPGGGARFGVGIKLKADKQRDRVR